MSTIAPDASRAVSAEFAKRGLTMLDAPISGSPITLAQGNAALMVGDDKGITRGRELALYSPPAD
jgi:3-hydroxyisobutyrate dehydrogenase